MLNTLIQKPPLTKSQKKAAMTVAIIADAVQIGLAPVFGPGMILPFDDILDVIAIILLVAICGWRWQFAVAFVLELVPGLDLFPTWSAFVLSFPTAEEGVEGQPLHAERVQSEPSPRPAPRHPIETSALPPVQPPPR